MAGSPGCIPETLVRVPCAVGSLNRISTVFVRPPHIADIPAWDPEVSVMSVKTRRSEAGDPRQAEREGVHGKRERDAEAADTVNPLRAAMRCYWAVPVKIVVCLSVRRRGG